jgi:K+-sensing histidine kinase KdpD
MHILNSGNNQTSSQTIFFIDWDNTIMPSHALLSNIFFFKNGKISDNIKVQLENLEQTAMALFINAHKVGKIYVVTNADDEWLESSAKTFFPNLSVMLNELKIILISAKTKYNKIYPKDNFKWKYEAFKSCMSEITNDETHIISIADGNLEEKILHMILDENIKKNNMTNCYIKTIILVGNPSIHQIQKQLTIILDKLEFITNCKNNIGIKLSIKSKNIKQN